MCAALFAILIVAKVDDVKVVMFDWRLPCPKTSDTIFLNVHMFLFVSKETRENATRYRIPPVSAKRFADRIDYAILHMFEEWRNASRFGSSVE